MKKKTRRPKAEVRLPFGMSFRKSEPGATIPSDRVRTGGGYRVLRKQIRTD